jgi:hypothetical protein
MDKSDKRHAKPLLDNYEMSLGETNEEQNLWSGRPCPQLRRLSAKTAILPIDMETNYNPKSKSK